MKTIISGIAALLLTAGVAVADKGGAPNANAADGQANAAQNCVKVINKQNANGQTGANTGNSNDPKALDTAVTNCDHFWQNIGAIGNPN